MLQENMDDNLLAQAKSLSSKVFICNHVPVLREQRKKANQRWGALFSLHKHANCYLDRSLLLLFFCQSRCKIFLPFCFPSPPVLMRLARARSGERSLAQATVRCLIY